MENRDLNSTLLHIRRKYDHDVAILATTYIAYKVIGHTINTLHFYYIAIKYIIIHTYIQNLDKSLFKKKKNCSKHA